ncbi:MAG: RidA family protein [Desulfurococcaceae archaeon]|nr:RidA family protein [Desulfurococcaceae archaeon]MCC6060707.1 RidA family protein [Desulfurococcaceae archaeon]
MPRAIYTPAAPKPIGPYSQGVIAGCFLFVSGQIPLDPTTGALVEGDFKARVRRVLDNVKAVVEAGGGSLRDVVKVTVYLRDIGLFQEFNEVYREYFQENPPARVVVGVSSLPRGADVEVEAIAYVCREGP